MNSLELLRAIPSNAHPTTPLENPFETPAMNETAPIEIPVRMLDDSGPHDAAWNEYTSDPFPATGAQIPRPHPPISTPANELQAANAIAATALLKRILNKNQYANMSQCMIKKSIFNNSNSLN